MGNLISLFGLLVIFYSCIQEHKELQNKDQHLGTVNTEQNEYPIQEKVKSVLYEASSRGTFLQIEIDSEHIIKSIDRSLQNKQEKQCSKKEWKKIQREINTVAIAHIDELNPPSNKKSTDRALQARLMLRCQTETYSSVTFDHGNPPKEIEGLVNTILSLGESIE